MCVNVGPGFERSSIPADMNSATSQPMPVHPQQEVHAEHGDGVCRSSADGDDRGDEIEEHRDDGGGDRLDLSQSEHRVPPVHAPSLAASVAIVFRVDHAFIAGGNPVSTAVWRITSRSSSTVSPAEIDDP